MSSSVEKEPHADPSIENSGSTRIKKAVHQSDEHMSTRARLFLFMILTGQFMATLDVSIVNVAARTIQDDLAASNSALQVIVAGYTVVFAVLLITASRMGHRHGYSRVFVIGTTMFTAASLACGLAPNSGSLMCFRLLQGAGAAFLVPQVMSLIQHSLSGHHKVRALGIYTAVLAGGAVVGQILGGVLVDADLFGSGWRPVFLVNVPIGIILLAASRRLLPVIPGVRDRQIDVPGLLVLALALGLFVLPLVLGHDLGWPTWTWAMLGGGVAAFVMFLWLERRVTAAGGDPLFEVSLMTAPTFIFAATAICLVLISFAGFLFIFALHMQGALGYSPVRAGLFFVPLVVGFGLAGLYWRRLPSRVHPRLPVLGLTMASMGYVALALLQRDGQAVGLSVEAVLGGVGLASGLAYGPLFGTALSRVAPAHAADASGVVNTLIQLGQVLGISIPGTIFLSLVTFPASPSHSGSALAAVALVIALISLAAATCAHFANSQATS
ncbi:MFS transporter [Streptomyces sp. NPDC059215]|uniref:MFS transporter n=1 Tax=Streptomyces sp. NPDC059215 TaxID=3346772 RepID=UPI003684F801